MGELRIRSAMDHFSAGSHSAARSDLEYVRDHFDCGVPYLHQMIGLIADLQQDKAAKAASVARLKEFGPEFDSPLDFSPRLWSIVTLGLAVNFGIIPDPSRAK